MRNRTTTQKMLRAYAESGFRREVASQLRGVEDCVQRALDRVGERATSRTPRPSSMTSTRSWQKSAS